MVLLQNVSWGSMEVEYFNCVCKSPEHTISIMYDKDFTEAYLNIHLAKLPFRKRLFYAWRYLWGYQCTYGAFDEFIIDRKTNKKLIKLLEKIKTLDKAK